MKKWIVCLSVICAICAIIFILQTEYCVKVSQILYRQIQSRKPFSSEVDTVKDYYLPTIIKTAICAFLALSLLVFNVVMLISISLGKLPNINIKEPLAQAKATRQQRKLEKAQAKVEKLKENIEKDA